MNVASEFGDEGGSPALPRADVPIPPEADDDDEETRPPVAPDGPTAACLTCGREARILVTLKTLVPHRPPGPWRSGDQLCDDARHYAPAVERWLRQGGR